MVDRIMSPKNVHGPPVSRTYKCVISHSKKDFPERLNGGLWYGKIAVDCLHGPSKNHQAGDNRLAVREEKLERCVLRKEEGIISQGMQGSRCWKWQGIEFSIESLRGTSFFWHLGYRQPNEIDFVLLTSQNVW